MNTIHPQDSLDNLSNLQINRQRQLQAQIKQQFAAGLQKLQSPQTREVGISQLKKIIEQYREQEYLRGYLALLKALKPSSNSATKEHQILTISLLAQTYKKQLLDPLDKPPSLLKTAFRVVQILHAYFNDPSPTVQQACARALLDLNSHCLGQQSLQTRFSIIYAPLISILKSGVDKSSQATASACLAQLIHYNRKIGDEELLRRLSPEMLSVILKVNSEYHELFHAVLGMLQSQQLQFLDGKIVSFLSKILPVIDGSRQLNSTNTTNLNIYMCKVNVCKILEKVAKLLPITQRQKLYELRIPESLQQAARHRIIQVQLAAGKALKAWRGEQVEDSPPKSQGRRLTSLQQKRNNKKLQRSKSKQERDKMESQLTFMKEDLQQLVKGGWGASNRAKKYVKKGSGIGGGYHGRSEISPNSKSPGKSHKQHFQELRQFIKKSAQENKHLDRFAQVRSQGQKRSESSAARSKSPPVKSKSPIRGEPYKKPKSKGSQQVQIGFKQDEGDQMVYMPYQKSQESRSAKSNIDKYPKGTDAIKNSHFKELGISQAEARQLIDHEQSLMDQGKKMNIKYTEMSEDPKKINKTTKPQNNINTEQMHITLNKNERNLQEKIKQQKFKGISAQEIGQLVDEYNLSQVSENINSILNQSDFKALDNEDIVDSNIYTHNEGKSDIATIKQIIADKKQRKSGISKFIKKQEQIQTKPVQDQDEQKQILQQVGQSLNFTVSNQSKAKSPIKREEIQFTLNPKDKFSTLKQQQSHQKQQQIQQQIAMSEYEESFPREQPLPIILPKVAPITQIPLRHTVAPYKIEKKQPQPEDKAEYQKLIKNPPKKEASKEPMNLGGSKATVKSEAQKSNFAAENQQNQDIKDLWFQLIRQAEKGETNTAYQMALQLDDPIYLLRLMLISKLQMKKLSPQTVRKLWRKFMQMYSQKFIDILTVGLLTQGNEMALLSKCLSVQQIQDALLGLYELSGSTKGKLSYKAATLYNQIEKSIHGN